MKTLNLKALLGLLFLFIFIGCKKEKPFTTNDSSSNEPNQQKTHIIGSPEGFQLNARSSGSMTVLGNERDNPYSVENMTAAWNQIYPNYEQSELPVTDLYVRFHPEDAEELSTLHEAIKDADCFLYDYPLEYEVIDMGEYYHDPSIPSGELTYYYSVVKPDFSFPSGIDYTVVDELVLAPYNSYLTAEAFRRTQNDYYDHQGKIVEFCDPSCPNYPSCLTYGVDCEGGDIQPLPLPCLPGAAHWPACLGLYVPASPTGSNPQTPGTTTNSCGCPIYTNIRKPGGCLEVEDTQLGFEGVKSVEVHVKDDWFTGRSVWTTNDGCWAINAEHYGRAWVTVQYYSSRVTVRGLRGVRLWEYGIPVRVNSGAIWGPQFNDIQIKHYNSHNDNSSIDRMLWFAATANNAVHEYDYFASQEGIDPAAPNLEIFLSNSNGSAAAPMFSHMFENPAFLVTATAQLATPNYTLDPANYIALHIPGLIPAIAQISPTFFAYFVANLPDVVYAYGDDPSYIKTDVVKETFYHEFGHSAHYHTLNDDYYWVENIKRTIDNSISGDNPPYGSAGTAGYERTAIIEAWGYHIGPFMANEQYQLFHSRNPNGTPGATTNQNKQTRWNYGVLERFNPTNTNNTDYWIPGGLFWDLIDNDVHNGSPLFVYEPITDDVVGVSNQTIFNALTTSSSANSLQSLKQVIINNHNNQNTEIQQLFNEYGY